MYPSPVQISTYKDRFSAFDEARLHYTSRSWYPISLSCTQLALTISLTLSLPAAPPGFCSVSPLSLFRLLSSVSPSLLFATRSLFYYILFLLFISFSFFLLHITRLPLIPLYILSASPFLSVRVEPEARVYSCYTVKKRSNQSNNNNYYNYNYNNNKNVKEFLIQNLDQFIIYPKLENLFQ